MFPSQPGEMPTPAATRLPHFRSGVIPAVHLSRSRAAAVPRVCLIGDSTGTLQADNVAAADTLWPMLMRRLRQDNPGRPFVFHNLSAGGTAWADAAAQFAAIREFAPDLVFTNYGLNNPQNAFSGYIRPFLAMLAELPTVPDCILITNKSSNPAVGEPHQDYDMLLAGAANQRSISASNGNGFEIVGQPRVGLIDIGRQFHIAVFGADPATQYLTRAEPIAPIAGLHAFPFALPRCDGDFALSVTFPGMGAAFAEARTIIQIDVPDTLRFESIDGLTFYARYYDYGFPLDRGESEQLVAGRSDDPGDVQGRAFVGADQRASAAGARYPGAPRRGPVPPGRQPDAAACGAADDRRQLCVRDDAAACADADAFPGLWAAGGAAWGEWVQPFQFDQFERDRLGGAAGDGFLPGVGRQVCFSEKRSLFLFYFPETTCLAIISF